MSLHKIEDQHHSPEGVGQHVRQALKIADKAKLSDADRAALLPTILTLLASKQIFYQDVNPSGIALPQNARH